MLISDIPTPALIVDVPALDRNIERMAAFFRQGPCRLRPHFKAHKTPAIAERQLRGGSTSGLTCATVFEAEVASAFCSDLLLANEVVSADKCRRVAALAGRVRMTVAVDSEAGVLMLASAARAAAVTVHVLVDLDVGQRRCGVPPGDAAVALARIIHGTDGLELDGVMGYEGHVQSIVGRDVRESAARSSMLDLVTTAALMRGSGLPCPVVSAGGTGTYDVSGRTDGVTEIQAGSYALMDSDYGRLGLPFEQALFALSTVVSRPVPERVVADCGHKACAKDHGHPVVDGIDGAVVVGLNDEHIVITVPPESAIRVGDRIRLRPSHVDPTMNLHDAVYAVEGDTVVGVWPVSARGYGERRAALGAAL